MTWQPIETARGGRVLAFWAQYGRESVRVAERMQTSDGGHWWRDPFSGRNLKVPTHWMPLPDPPKDTE